MEAAEDACTATCEIGEVTALSHLLNKDDATATGGFVTDSYSSSSTSYSVATTVTETATWPSAASTPKKLTATM